MDTMASLRTRALRAITERLRHRGSRVGTGIAFGPHPRQRLDIYWPAADEAETTHPLAGDLFIFFYGGTWASGERWLYRFVGTAFAAQGATVLIPDVRLAPDHGYPDFMHDAARVLGLAQRFTAVDRTGRNRCDGGRMRLHVMGHSAGGHMAALLANRADLLAMAAAVSAHVEKGAAGPTDSSGETSPVAVLEALAKPLATCADTAFLPSGALQAGTSSNGDRAIDTVIGLAAPYAMFPTVYAGTREIFAAAQHHNRPRPIAHVSPASPPHLMLHGGADTLIERWIVDDYATALRAHGVAHRYILLPGMGHLAPILALLPGLGRLWDRDRAVMHAITQFVARQSDLVAAANNRSPSAADDDVRTRAEAKADCREGPANRKAA